MQIGDTIIVTWQDAHLVRGAYPFDQLTKHNLPPSEDQGVFLGYRNGYIMVGFKKKPGSRINEVQFVPRSLIIKVSKVIITEEILDGSAQTTPT